MAMGDEHRARGTYKPGRPSNEHAKGFSRALEAALNDLREQFPEELDAPKMLGEITISFGAVLTVRNPADIDEYHAFID
jgi:hypothetical protein